MKIYFFNQFIIKIHIILIVISQFKENDYIMIGFTIKTLACQMMIPVMRQHTHKLAPKIEPTASRSPSLCDAPAEKDVITSGAPLAKARRVTPATLSDKSRYFAIRITLGVK